MCKTVFIANIKKTGEARINIAIKDTVVKYQKITKDNHVTNLLPMATAHPGTNKILNKYSKKHYSRNLRS